MTEERCWCGAPADHTPAPVAVCKKHSVIALTYAMRGEIPWPKEATSTIDFGERDDTVL